MNTVLPRRLLRPFALALLLSGCGGGGGGSGKDDPFGDIYEPVQPAVVGAPYAAALADCTFNATRQTSCPLSTLPFLGQETDSVSVDRLMERVITSSPWMAQRLRAALEALPADILAMSRSLTAIVVGSRIRPAFYDSSTGAIYLDPAYLWVTQAELATIDKSQDYRAGFGNDLQFAVLWRYVKDNDYAYGYFPLDYPYDRRPEDIQLPLARLLFHELTHAADFMPPAALATLSRDQRLSEAVDAQAGSRISDQLVRTQPLTSSVWSALADVLYRGVTASAQQRAYTPADVASAFTPDRASDSYAYSTQFEDTAMLAEEALMYAHYGIERDLAFTNLPPGDDATGDDFLVSWGVRGRIREPRVTAAARQVLAGILPGHDFDATLGAPPAPTPMQSGASWNANLALVAPAQAAGTAKSRVPIRSDDRRPPG